MSESNFKVLRAGINTTYQDLGRKNLYHIGIPFSGAMDNRNYLIANSLVGNEKKTPVIEFAYQGPLLKLKGTKTSIAVTGDVIFNILRKDSQQEKGICYQTYSLEDGDQIDILTTNKSVYGYLAVSGGYNVEFFWDSCSTNTKAKIGANNGEKINNGDLIFVQKSENNVSNRKINYVNSKIEKLRILKGTNYNYFSEEGKKNFFLKKNLQLQS